MASPASLRAGVGLKPDYYRAVLEAGAGDADSSVHDLEGFWVEVHPENYMTPGGPRLAWLDAIRGRWPVSLHGVGASLGGAEPLDAEHLSRLRALVDRVEPALVSEHVAWSARGGVYFADLLPLPATRRALDNLVANIDQMQTALGRPILIENPALYLSLHGDLEEPDFLVEACRRAGCGLLVDVNNVFVCARNLGRDALGYLDAMPPDLVGEIHLAGHAPDPRLGEALLIDDHGAPVAEAVWSLYEHALARFGPRPTLIERDANLPPFEELMAERGRAQDLLIADLPNRNPSTENALDRVEPPPSARERPHVRSTGRSASREERPDGSDLAGLQDRFAAGLLTGALPRDVQPAMRDRDWPSRYAVYQNNVVTALGDAVAHNHPAVARLVGDAFMRAAAAAYVRAHPSMQRALTLAGEGFADLLHTFPPARDLPYLPDVARMDRAWLEATFAAAAPPLDLEALSATGDDALAALAPGLVASARVVASDFPAYAIWRANRDGDGAVRVRLDAGGETALFWRAGSSVCHRALARGEAAFAQALGEGEALAAAGARALAVDPSFDLAATFGGLLAAGALARPAGLVTSS